MAFVVSEYLAGNSKRKYPFVDNATLTSTSNVELGENWFLDGVIVLKNENHPVYLYRLENTGTHFIFILANTENDVEVINFSVSHASVVENDFFYGENSKAVVKFTAGKGLQDAKQTIFSYEFVKTATRFNDRVVVARSSSIRVRVKNKDVYSSWFQPDTLSIYAGSNISLEKKADNLFLNVVPGAGTGLYDACAEEVGIKTINFVGSSERNFSISTGECYYLSQLDPNDVWRPNGFLGVYNGCNPQCLPEQLEAYIRYFNRTNDAYVDLTTYVNTMSSKAKTLMESLCVGDTPYFIPVYSITDDLNNQIEAVLPSQMPLPIACLSAGASVVVKEPTSLVEYVLVNPADATGSTLVPPDFDALDPLKNLVWENKGNVGNKKYISVALTFVNPTSTEVLFDTSVACVNSEVSNLVMTVNSFSKTFTPTTGTLFDPCAELRDTTISGSGKVPCCGLAFAKFKASTINSSPASVAVTVTAGSFGAIPPSPWSQPF